MVPNSGHFRKICYGPKHWSVQKDVLWFQLYLDSVTITPDSTQLFRCRLTSQKYPEESHTERNQIRVLAQITIDL